MGVQSFQHPQQMELCFRPLAGNRSKHRWHISPMEGSVLDASIQHAVQSLPSTVDLWSQTLQFGDGTNFSSQASIGTSEFFQRPTQPLWPNIGEERPGEFCVPPGRVPPGVQD